MMQRVSSFAAAVALTLGFASTVTAQAVTTTIPPPEFEFSVAYQFLRVGSDGSSNTFPTGFAFDGARYYGPLAILAELGWSKDSTSVPGTSISTNFFHIGGGPRLLFVRDAKVRPYVQVLGGVSRAKSTTEFSLDGGVVSEVEVSDTAFMVQPGAGVTYQVGDAWGVFGSVDYRRSFFNEGPGLGYSNTNEVRILFGIRMIID